MIIFVAICLNFSQNILHVSGLIGDILHTVWNVADGALLWFNCSSVRKRLESERIECQWAWCCRSLLMWSVAAGISWMYAEKLNSILSKQWWWKSGIFHYFFINSLKCGRVQSHLTQGKLQTGQVNRYAICTVPCENYPKIYIFFLIPIYIPPYLGILCNQKQTINFIWPK